MDAELWARWKADWRRMEAAARRRGWEVTALAISRPASTVALRRLEAAGRQPVPPQLVAALRRSARVAFGWYIPSHLQAAEREDMPTGSANRGAIWDLDHIEQMVTSYGEWRRTLAEDGPDVLAGPVVDWDRLFPFYTLPNGDLLAIDPAPDGPQPVRYVSHEFDMLHGAVLAPDFFTFVTEMSQLGFAGTEWASWLRFGTRDGDAFLLRADSEGGKVWLAWLARDPARPAPDEPPPGVLPETPADRALLLAARAGDVGGVQAALEGGATPDAIWSDENATALTYAVRAGDGPMLDLLLARGASPDTRRLAVGDAVEAGPPAVLTRLLAHGARVNGWKGDRHWPLHLLVTRRAKAVAPTLEEYQARVSAETSGRASLGDAAFIAAFERQRLARYLTPGAHLAMLDALLAGDADPDAPWDNGLTMLMQGDAATVRVLPRYGADVHARDSFGGTALHGVRSPGCWWRTGRT